VGNQQQHEKIINTATPRQKAYLTMESEDRQADEEIDWWD
jgi:hypothetical protein